MKNEGKDQKNNKNRFLGLKNVHIYVLQNVFPSIYYVIEYKTDFLSRKYCLVFIFICIFGDLLIEKSFGNLADFRSAASPPVCSGTFRAKRGGQIGADYFPFL